MAKIYFDGLDDYIKLLENIEVKRNSIIKPAVYDGAAVLIEEVKQNLRRVVGPDSTGDLEQSIGLAEMQDRDGFVHTKLGFDGYDRNHHPNVVKARALEHGTSKQQKKPFIRTAVNKCKDDVVQTMAKTVDTRIKKLMDERG
jgi:HK97 gp10 family phage protein